VGTAIPGTATRTGSRAASRVRHDGLPSSHQSWQAARSVPTPREARWRAGISASRHVRRCGPPAA
jgi:hypothetical protein